MSHIQCPRCRSHEHISGYGLAIGPIGTYTICECDMLLEMVPDTEGMTEEQEKAAIACADRLLTPYREACRAFVVSTAPPG